MTESHARCALHFDLASVGTCARCGRFMCEACRASVASSLCATCGPLVGDPFQLRDKSFDFLTPFLLAPRLLLADWWKVLVITAIFALPISAVQAALASDAEDLKATLSSIRLTSVYDALVGIIGAQAILALFIARVEGRVLSLGGAFVEGFGVWGHTLGTRIRSGLTLLVFFLFLVLPGIWKAVMLMFAQVAALRLKDHDALDASERLVRGRFWSMFGFGMTAVVVLYVPMVIALVGLGMVMEAAGVPALLSELVGTIVSGVFVDGAMTAVLYVAFVLLHRAAGVELPEMRWSSEPPLAPRA